MYFAFFLDFLALVILIRVLFPLWNERRRFHSLKPLVAAIVLISFGRLCDMMAEHPSLQLSNLLGLSTTAYDTIIVIVGNLSDVVGIAFLVLGFLRVIRFAQKEEAHIHDLEALLPICSNCKKYRSKAGEWMPIEKYLIENGSPRLSHGICPDCARALYGRELKSAK